MELAVPILVVDNPAVALANLMASLMLYFSFSVKATANPPLNASPAPVVSSTGLFRSTTGT